MQGYDILLTQYWLKLNTTDEWSLKYILMIFNMLNRFKKSSKP